MSRFEKFKLYHKKYLGLELDDNGMNELSRSFSKIVVDKVIEAPFVSGALDFLIEHYEQYDFFISSATPESEVREISKQKNISKYFKKIYGSPKSKVFHIENIVKKFRYKKNELVFIGDSINDLVAAKKCGIKFIARIIENNNQLVDEKFQMEDLNKLKSIISNII